MNELSCIQAFVSIVENGSQLEASKRLNQTGAAINKKLAKLETKLGVLLLERDTKSSKLTPIGEQYYHIYRDILDKLEDASQIALKDKAKPKGRLLISVNASIAKNYLAPRIAEFTSLYPDIFLVLDIAEKTADFIPGKQDILIAPDYMQYENLVRKKIFETSDILCASPSYIKFFGSPEDLQSLHQHRYIGQCQRQPLNQIILSKKHQTEINKPFMRVNDERIAIELALQGLGFIYIKSSQVDEYLSKKELVQLLPEITKNKTSYSMYYHAQNFTPPKVRAFLDFFSA